MKQVNMLELIYVYVAKCIYCLIVAKPLLTRNAKIIRKNSN